MGGTPLLILVPLLGSAAVVEVVDGGIDGVFLAFMGVSGSDGEADFTAGACDGNLDCIPSRSGNHWNFSRLSDSLKGVGLTWFEVSSCSPQDGIFHGLNPVAGRLISMFLNGGRFPGK